jgi:hypothetical protein
MVKIKYVGSNDFDSKGISFLPGFAYDVKEEVAEYLKKTFGDAFEVEAAKTVKPKLEEKK